MKNSESQRIASRQCLITCVEKAVLDLPMQITEKDSKSNCMWNCKQHGGGCKRKMHDKSTWSVPDSFVCTEMVLWDSLQKTEQKKLRSWVQKIKLHFHWSQTC